LNVYKNWLRPTLFRLDPEQAHDLAIDLAARTSDLSFVDEALRRSTAVRDPRLRVDLDGLSFETPVGLAAGYDKSGRAVDGLSALGFGHIEVGSVSRDPSDGNPKPRLFRLPEDEAVIVHYGLQNDGADVVRSRLLKRRTSTPIGGNIVKTNRGIDAPAESADEILREYVDAVRILHDCSDYLMLNLSCPNTEDGRDFFADPGNMREMMARLAEVTVQRPLYLKVSPLGGDEALEQLLEAVEPFGFVRGFAFNLAPGVHASLRTDKRVWGELRGALAGKPVEEQMNDRIRSLYGRMDRSRYAIIGVGGVSSGEDAYRKIRLGASAVQLLTALVYEGPWVVKRIHEGLCGLLERDGFGSVSDAVGVDVG